MTKLASKVGASVRTRLLKGATLFSVWTGAPHRATRDVDLLGYGDASEGHIRDVFADVIALEVEDDGLEFDVDASMRLGHISDEENATNGDTNGDIVEPAESHDPARRPQTPGRLARSRSRRSVRSG